jgi:GH24 family phage-related lysozyme (muramidase)
METEIQQGVLPVNTVTPMSPYDPLVPEYVYETETVNLDLFGLSSTPSWGMDTVTITAKKLTPYWDFGYITVAYAEYTVVQNGGGGSPSNNCGHNYQDVNWGQIELFEGNRLDGYVPNGKNGLVSAKSGVTIASGFDLGSKSASDLGNLGFSDALINTLSPYLGMKAQAARDYENAHPLNVSASDAVTINSASHAATLAAVVAKYDKAVAVNGAFFTLPNEAQTVIVSVAFQYGDLATKTPNFWNQVVSKNWTAALENLRNFQDDFPTRRNQEADLLENALNSGRLNNGGLC